MSEYLCTFSAMSMIYKYNKYYSLRFRNDFWTSPNDDDHEQPTYKEYTTTKTKITTEFDLKGADIRIEIRFFGDVKCVIPQRWFTLD